MKKNLRYIILPIIDICILVFSWAMAMLLQHAGVGELFATNWYFVLMGGVVVIGVNAAFKLYTKLFRYINIKDVFFVVVACAINCLYFVLITIISPEITVDIGIVAILIYIPLSVISRVIIRYYFTLLAYMQRRKHLATSEDKRIILIGAGAAAAVLTNEMDTTDKIVFKPVCALDDDPDKQNLSFNGVKVVGKIADVVEVAKKYNANEIVIAIPSASKKRISEIIKLCQQTNCEIKILPGVYQFITGQISLSDIRKVNISDLLGREQVKVNLDEIMTYIEKKVVLVTGGGGSIGSELCRQIASHNPKQLIIFDIYENNAYAIEQELKRNLPKLNLLTLIGSVRDKVKVKDVFSKYKPEIVFHAAAHKHVPLMETSPNEAVKNNVGGTLNVAEAAGENGVKKFILISTDKAVNPTNIMGATKRICEMIIQTMNSKFDTDYVAVRFGNVLGSNGSVIPLFREQIANGGPITVTHKDIVRYFMTIPEAVSLVLQAGAYAKGGEIFVLDMGEQVRIYDLAINMIKLSGLEPFKDIDIKITGLRPGEKLYEERLMAEEGLQKTSNEMISIGKPIEIDKDKLYSTLDKLIEAAYKETDDMKDLVKELVTTYEIDKRKK